MIEPVEIIVYSKALNTSRLWLKIGNQEFPMAYVPDEEPGEENEQARWMAEMLKKALNKAGCQVKVTVRGK